MTVKVHQMTRSQTVRSQKTKKMTVKPHQTTRSQTVRSQKTTKSQMVRSLKTTKKAINLKDQHQLVKTVNGKNVKNLMVSWVVLLNVLLTFVNFHVMTVLESLMVHQRLNA